MLGHKDCLGIQRGGDEHCVNRPLKHMEVLSKMFTDGSANTDSLKQLMGVCKLENDQTSELANFSCNGGGRGGGLALGRPLIPSSWW